LAKRRSPLLDFINTNTLNLKFIIAHNIKRNQIEQFKTVSKKKLILRKAGESLADFDVFIIDTIGILTKIYSYADIAFVVVVLGILAFITY
jgi:3-deoxy-D-manno-octulosonic-acid transferase